MDDGGMFIKVAAGGSSDGCTDKDWYEVPKVPSDVRTPQKQQDPPHYCAVWRPNQSSLPPLNLP